MPKLIPKVKRIKKGIVLALVGSRNNEDKKQFWFEVNEFRKIHEVVAIVSGGGGDTDRMAEVYAEEHGIKFILHPAKWHDLTPPCVKKKGKYGVYNAMAGVKRNTDIVNTCTLMIAFWDGSSSGTYDSITKAKTAGKLHKIVNIIRC